MSRAPDERRRRLLKAAVASGLLYSSFRPGETLAAKNVVNDVSGLNPISVAGERQPRSADDIRAILRAWQGPISIGGGRFSMGGQIAAAESLHLDMRRMNGIVSLDPGRKVIRVQAGASWRDIQEAIDPHDLSVKIMQSYSNFTVGGSVSVNCHGRYVGQGPLVNSVRALQMVTSEGEVLELTRVKDGELFRAVFGGYGGLGIVTEVELDLAMNSRIERSVGTMALDAYPTFFREQIVKDQRIIFHNADLTPPNFDAPKLVSWVVTDKAVTDPHRLVPRGLNYTREKNAIWAITELPGGASLRSKVERAEYSKPAVVWRNREASLDTASLEPRTRSISTYLLQEYFIPVDAFLSFVAQMSRTLRLHKVNALNVSIRHSPADTLPLLTWAPAEVFSLVLYYKQRSRESVRDGVDVWTRELIDLALKHGGRYYLPYRLAATQQQFDAAYPEARAFSALKTRVDPKRRLRNLLLDKYLPA